MSRGFGSSGELAKGLGLLEALTIGIGTMIGAGIFILPRYAVDMVGPGAVLVYILAGLVCLITAASTAELATAMPKCGGAYFFISRSMGPLMGAISGLSVWLSLTFAVAFYLKGFGDYLALMIPLPGTLLALLTGVIFTYINYIGVKESGRTQNAIVIVLLGILLGYAAWGAFHVDGDNLHPFLPHGAGTMLPATAVIFVSFVGFAQIASVAEEIKDPARNLPGAIIGSVAVVTVIYAFVILVTVGITPHDTFFGIDAPLVHTAGTIAGLFGMTALMIAALLATASSANASILASSRINFALGRDMILPDWLNEIHPKFFTPHRPIILTGALALLLIVVSDVESLSSSASVLMLINYGLVNLGVLIMRSFTPEGYRAAYRSPGYPYLHILGAAVSFFIIFQAGFFAKASAVVLMVVALAWYFAWARHRTTVVGAAQHLPRLILNGRTFQEADVRPGTATRPTRRAGVLVLLANPVHEEPLLTVASSIAMSQPGAGRATAMNVMEIPPQAPLDLAQYRREILRERQKTLQDMMSSAVEYGRTRGLEVEPRIIYSRDKTRTVINLIDEEGFDFALLGWHGSLSIGRIYHSMVKQLVRRARCPVGVLKNNGLEKVRRVLVPFRGSEHALWGIRLASEMVSGVKDGRVTILRVVSEGVNEEEEKSRVISEISGDVDPSSVGIKVVHGDRVIDGIMQEVEATPYDLVVMGASKEWILKSMLFGSVPDLVAEECPVSVLMVRSYDTSVSRTMETDISQEEQAAAEEPRKI